MKKKGKEKMKTNLLCLIEILETFRFYKTRTRTKFPQCYLSTLFSLIFAGS